MKLLLVIEDVFAIQGRGSIVVPEVDLGARATLELVVEVRRPDGSRETCTAQASIPMPQPMPARRSHHVLLLPIAKPDLPVGSEIWTDD